MTTQEQHAHVNFNFCFAVTIQGMIFASATPTGYVAGKEKIAEDSTNKPRATAAQRERTNWGVIAPGADYDDTWSHTVSPKRHKEIPITGLRKAVTDTRFRTQGRPATAFRRATA